MGSSLIYQHAGAILLRATTYSNDLKLPQELDLSNNTVVTNEGRAWLAAAWQRSDVRSAIWVASPELTRQIDTLLTTSAAPVRRVRRVLISLACYLLRWRQRTTPFGLFAGITTASISNQPTVRFGDEHRVTARPDASWLGHVVSDLERDPDLLPRLLVTANNMGSHRGNRYVVPKPASDPATDYQEASVRDTQVVRMVLTAARTPIRFSELIDQLCARFPQASRERLDALLTDLIAQDVVVTELRAPMTNAHPLDQLIAQLDAVGAAELPGVASVLEELAEIGQQLSRHNHNASWQECGRIRSEVDKRMRAIRSTDQTLALDVRVDAEVTVPETVLTEAEIAATTLLRLTANPFGSPNWRDFHFRFLFRYGAGAMVPVQEAVADSGLGFPAGFLGASREPSVPHLSDRDETLLGLIQKASLDGQREIELTEPVIRSLTVGDQTGMMAPPRVELAFQLHARSTTELARGRFQLWVTGAPRPASSMAGRFAYLLSEQDQQNLADSFMPSGDALAAQLSFPPRRRRNDNLARVPRLLPATIHLAEHEDNTGGSVTLDDLAVTADSSQMYLINRSTGAMVQPRVLHALEASVQTPPLARFLAEIWLARYGVYGPFEFGAARRLPFRPRLRRGRAVLTPARWLLTKDDLPAPRATTREWETALAVWRERWHVPTSIVLYQADMRLPLDLNQRFHRGLLRARLDRASRLELQEAPPPGALGWIGRAHELLVTLTSTAPPPTDRHIALGAPAAVAEDMLLPGSSSLLFAQIFGHPARFDDFLAEHLPGLLNQADEVILRWWFRRHRDHTRPEEEQHLGLYLRLASANDYGAVAKFLAGWAAGLLEKGLLARINLASHQPQTGRYGHGAAMDAAEEVFTADSNAALAQLGMSRESGVPCQTIAAASMADVAISFAASPEAARRWLVEQLPQGRGPLDRSLRDTTLMLANPDNDHVALRRLPGGRAVTVAWHARRVALTSYRERLAKDRDPLSVMRSLLHDHHVRAVGVDVERELVTNRLVRAAAQRQVILARRGTQ